MQSKDHSNITQAEQMHTRLVFFVFHSVDT